VNTIIVSLGTAILMAISIASASAKDKLSEAFLKKAIEGNFAEVSMGDLAQKNGQSDGVKSYGKMLSTDHAAANQKALDAAKDLGMSPPAGPNAKQKAGNCDRVAQTRHHRKRPRKYLLGLVKAPTTRCSPQHRLHLAF
jgi:putative membrane protein